MLKSAKNTSEKQGVTQTSKHYIFEFFGTYHDYELEYLLGLCSWLLFIAFLLL